MPRKGGCLYKVTLCLLPSWGQAPPWASSLRASQISILWYRRKAKGTQAHGQAAAGYCSFPFLLDIKLALNSWPSWLSLWSAGWDMPPCLSVFSCETSIQVYKRIMTTFLGYKLIRDLQEWSPNLSFLFLLLLLICHNRTFLGWACFRTRKCSSHSHFTMWQHEQTPPPFPMTLSKDAQGIFNPTDANQ